VSTCTVVVALHIIAVLAAYGLPVSAPLLVPIFVMAAKPFS
jgi:hypothetical protein